MKKLLSFVPEIILVLYSLGVFGVLLVAGCSTSGGVEGKAQGSVAADAPWSADKPAK